MGVSMTTIIRFPPRLKDPPVELVELGGIACGHAESLFRFYRVMPASRLSTLRHRAARHRFLMGHHFL